MAWKFMLITSLLCTVAFAFSELEEKELLEDMSENELDDLEDILREIETQGIFYDHQRENEQARRMAMEEAAERAAYMLANPNAPPFQSDPCAKVHCGAGRVCQTKNDDAACVCIPECPEETDMRRRVCTNRNETWPSDCEIYRQHCLCDTNSPDCRDKSLKHIHINYYGECKSMPSCSEEEMSDFPRRMRDWLFNVMRDLAERNELPDYYLELEHEAETNHSRRWANAAVWKWCDLDGHPNDKSVSRHELFPIRAPLMSLEHCIAPFLETCDPDKNHRITLKEWGNCLQIEDGDLMERCDNIKKQAAEKRKG